MAAWRRTQVDADITAVPRAARRGTGPDAGPDGGAVPGGDGAIPGEGARGSGANGCAPGAVAPSPRPSRADAPREKLDGRGAGALSDAELLALVIGTGTRRRSALAIGRRLARRAPAQLGAWPLARWRQVPGIGTARACALAAAFELGRRAAERPSPSPAIRGPDDVRAQVRDLPRARREHFVVLLLNARHELQARETVSIGSLNASIVHPREVFLPAILHSAASVVLVHNHPSGDPEPSEEDLGITRRLVQVGELVGIAVLDHVIVAARGVVSLRARELL